MKSRRMRCVGHVVRMEMTKNVKIFVGKYEGKRSLGRIALDRKIILKRGFFF
jgi:ribosomal protein S17